MIEVREYLDTAGRSPYAKWFDGLDPRAAAKATTTVTRISQGNFSQTKGVGAGVYERRLDFGPGYRIYFGKDGNQLVILLGGGAKKAQSRGIDDAKRLWQDYKSRKEAGEMRMALTRDFKETIKARADRDPDYRRALFLEGVQCLLAGDVRTGKTVLRDYINASLGFEALAAATHHASKSLMRMFSSRGNPRANNLFKIVAYLQQKEGRRLVATLTLSARNRARRYA